LRARRGLVKRMLAAVGNRCERLHRVAIGGILLGELPEGEWRHLTPEEVETLLQKNYG
jgi:16S rRNA pseudouridine516 synthase